MTAFYIKKTTQQLALFHFIIYLNFFTSVLFNGIRTTNICMFYACSSNVSYRQYSALIFIFSKSCKASIIHNYRKF